jgi:hypothetical protein
VAVEAIPLDDRPLLVGSVGLPPDVEAPTGGDGDAEKRCGYDDLG